MVFDIVFVLIFLWAAYKGFSKGFILQAATLAALILGIYGSIRFSGYVSSIITGKWGYNGEYIALISFAVTFIGIVIGIHFLARIIEKLLEMVALSFLNRIFGIFFNLVKYAFIISVVLVLLNNLNRTMHFLPEEKINASRLYKPLSLLAPMVFPYLHFNLQHPLEIPEKYREEILV